MSFYLPNLIFMHWLSYKTYPSYEEVKIKLWHQKSLSDSFWGHLTPFYKKIQETFNSDYLGPNEAPIINRAAGGL